MSPAGGLLASRVPAAELYEQALRNGGRTPLLMHTPFGERPLPLARWCAPADAVDAAALDRYSGHLAVGAGVLDLGCGPGRHTELVRRSGLRALGVDTSAVAVALTRRRGAEALLADARGPLPGGDHGWDGVLLLDGNIGIGGDPLLLLCRVRDLLSPYGRVLLELEADGRSARFEASLADGVRSSTGFPWARLGAGPELEATLCAADLRATDGWMAGGRHFLVLQPRAASRRRSA